MLFAAEWKRLFCRVSTWIVALIMLAAGAALPIVCTLGTSAPVIREDGTMALAHGVAAVHERNRILVDMQGTPVLPDKLKTDLRTYQALLTKYNQDIPDEVYCREVYPIEPYLSLMTRVYGCNMAGLASVSPDRVDDFYSERAQVQQKYLATQLGEGTHAYDQAMAAAKKVSVPFVFQADPTLLNCLSNVSLLVLILLLLDCILGARAFAGDYQDHSVTVFRASRYGKEKLARARVLAFNAFTLGMYGVSVLAYTAGCLYVVGPAGFRSPIQLTNMLAVWNLTCGQVYLLSVLAGGLAVLAVTSFCLWISAGLNAPLIVLSACLAMFALKMGVGALPGKLSIFIGTLFPSSGAEMYGELFRVNFFTAGGIAIWTPVLITAAGWIMVILFPCLAVRAYCRHEQ